MKNMNKTAPILPGAELEAKEKSYEMPDPLTWHLMDDDEKIRILDGRLRLGLDIPVEEGDDFD